MLANQLPLLQLGREEPEVRGQIDQYCHVDGTKQRERLLKKLSIIALSDPNDVLSYAIPPMFADEHLDSRLCPKVTNIDINVAKVVPVLGLGKLASPLEAHSGYDEDERVIGLIAKGIGHDQVDPVVAKRCTWIETIEQ